MSFFQPMATISISSSLNSLNTKKEILFQGYREIEGLPVSHLSGGIRVGPDFFKRRSAVDDTTRTSGLVDDFDKYEYDPKAKFKLKELDPLVRDFYEHTDNYELEVQAMWQRGFKNLSKVLKGLGLTMNQIIFPSPKNTEFTALKGELLPINGSKDGRANPRAWIRTYPGTNKALYVAAYSFQVKDGKPYVNVAFPVPGGNLTSVLNVQTTELSNGKKGLLLAAPPNDPDSRNGMYFANRFRHVRLPLHETIEVWSEKEDADFPLKAQHKFWLGKKSVLILNYNIALKKGRES